MPLSNRDLERRLAAAEQACGCPYSQEHLRIARSWEAFAREVLPDARLDAATLPTEPLAHARACYERIMAWIRDGMSDPPDKETSAYERAEN